MVHLHVRLYGRTYQSFRIPLILHNLQGSFISETIMGNQATGREHHGSYMPEVGKYLEKPKRTTQPHL